MLKKKNMSTQRRRTNSNHNHDILLRLTSCCNALRHTTTFVVLLMVLWLGWVGQHVTRHMSDVALASLRRRSRGASSTSSFWWTDVSMSGSKQHESTSDLISIQLSRDHRRRRTTVKNRSIVKPNEFFLPPNESSWRYFDESASRPLDFTLHLPSNTSGGYDQVPALWQCQHQPNKDEADASTGRAGARRALAQRRHSKIIFIHLSRSAGNMVRSLLQFYGKYCQASYAVILACADLSFQSAQAGSWYNGRRRRQGNHCQLKEAFHRTGGIVSDRKKGYVSTAFLEKMDIISGQLPLGSADQAWKYYYAQDDKAASTTTTDARKVQYIVLLRDPIAKFISDEVARAWRKATTTQSAVAMIRQKVMSERAQGDYHDSYTPHLVTPEQHFQYEFHEVRPTMGQYVNVSMSNLVDLNVVIGIVERMPQTLQLLQHVLDSQYELDDLFQYFGAGKTTPHSRPIWPSNRQPGLSTDEVLEHVRQDAELYRMVKEYVKYEIKIYNFALELHKRQFEKLPKRRQQVAKESSKKR